MWCILNTTGWHQFDLCLCLHNPYYTSWGILRSIPIESSPEVCGVAETIIYIYIRLLPYSRIRKSIIMLKYSKYFAEVVLCLHFITYSKKMLSYAIQFWTLLKSLLAQKYILLVCDDEIYYIYITFDDIRGK